MNRSRPLGRTPLHFVLLALALALACVAALPERATAGEGGQSSDFVSVRVHVLDPPEVTPGDDDQPTIVSRKRARQVQLAAEPSGGGPGGSAIPVEEPRSTIWSRWTEPFRAFVGRLGLLLRMPS